MAEFAKRNLSHFKVVFALFGLAIFVFLVQRIGLDRISGDIRLVGYKILLLIPLALSWHFLNSLAWLLLVRKSGLSTSLLKIFVNKWAAESLNSALPLGNLGGEAFRVLALSGNMNKESALSNVVTDRLLHYTGSLLFICGGSIFGIIYLGGITFRTRILLLLSITLLLATFLAAKAIIKKGLFKIKAPIVRPYLDALSKDLFNTNSKICWTVILLNLAGRLLGSVEIYIVLHFLGHPLPFLTCLLYSSFLVLINLVFFIVPGGIGILEGGQVAFMVWLGFSPATGMSLAIIRRLRLMIIVAIGLILVPFVPELRARKKISAVGNTAGEVAD